MQAAQVAGRFYNGALHPQTDTQKRNFVFARVFNGGNFAVHAAPAKSARD